MRERRQASQYARSLIEASLDPLVTITAFPANIVPGQYIRFIDLGPALYGQKLGTPLITNLREHGILRYRDNAGKGEPAKADEPPRSPRPLTGTKR